LRSRTSDWNVDLVFGEPPLGFTSTSDAAEIPKCTPSTIQIAVEIKSVMTEHNKAIRNRKRDFEAHHGHVHEYSPSAIAGGVLVVNGSLVFKSPLRDDITSHKDPGSLMKLCMDQMRAVAQRTNVDGVGLDVKAVIVVGMDNINNHRTKFITKAPAPLIGDPLHYDAFIQALCHLYTERFSRLIKQHSHGIPNFEYS